MAMERYNPTARASSRQMPSNGATPGNLGQGDPVNGYPFGSTTPGYIDYRDPSVNGAFYPGTTRQRYQDDPNARKVHTPGSDRHSQEEKYFGREIGGVGPAGPPVEWNSGFYDQQHAGDVQRKRELLAGNEPYQKAKAAGDLKGQIAAMTALRGQMQEQRWIDQGGTEETYRNRFNRDWPKPRSPLGAYSHGPGSADWDTRFTNPPPPNTAGASAAPQGGGVRRGATPQTAPMSGGMPPSQNPMFEGYLGGGAGVPSGPGGWGPAGGSRMDMSNFARDEQMALQNARMRQGGTDWWNPGGGYQPGQSKSGMGQMPTNSMMGTGTFYGDPSMAATQGRNFPPIGLPTGPRTPVGPYTPPTFDPTGRTAPGGGDFSNLMALFNLQAGGLNASPFGGGGFGMPGGGPEGMMQFGGYRPAAPQGMMYY